MIGQTEIEFSMALVEKAETRFAYQSSLTMGFAQRGPDAANDVFIRIDLLDVLREQHASLLDAAAKEQNIARGLQFS